MNIIPYILFATSLPYSGNLLNIASSVCNQTAYDLQFTNGQTFPRLAGFPHTYNASRPFVGRTGLTIALNESMLLHAPLVRSLWDANVGCFYSNSKLWSGLNDSSTFTVNVNNSESPGPHCDGYYSNTTLIPPFNPWTSNHSIDGASVMKCDSTGIGWESSRNGMTCDNKLQLLCVFDPNPATVSLASYELLPRKLVGTRQQTSVKCDTACLSSQKSVALLYYRGEMTRFPQDLLYKNGMTGTTSVVLSKTFVNERITLFDSFENVNLTTLTASFPSFFTGQQNQNCNNFTSRSDCATVTLNLDSNRVTSCSDIGPNIVCACYNEQALQSHVPTASPSISPTMVNPTKSPTTSSPSNTPTTSLPSKTPTTSKPSTSPTKAPTKIPTTLIPTVSPTKSPTMILNAWVIRCMSNYTPFDSGNVLGWDGINVVCQSTFATTNIVPFLAKEGTSLYTLFDGIASGGSAFPLRTDQPLNIGPRNTTNYGDGYGPIAANSLNDYLTGGSITPLALWGGPCDSTMIVTGFLDSTAVADPSHSCFFANKTWNLYSNTSDARVGFDDYTSVAAWNNGAPNACNGQDHVGVYRMFCAEAIHVPP